MKVYYVLKHGVYMQGIYGIYDSKEKAIEAMKEAKSKESDNYHDFYICIRNLNEKTYEDITEK